jgi:hypothetical protein
MEYVRGSLQRKKGRVKWSKAQTRYDNRALIFIECHILFASIFFWGDRNVVNLLGFTLRNQSD